MRMNDIYNTQKRANDIYSMQTRANDVSICTEWMGMNRILSFMKINDLLPFITAQE
jgi:hypothetical protein